MKLPARKSAAAFLGAALLWISPSALAEERKPEAVEEIQGTHRLPIILEKADAAPFEALAVIEDGEHERPVLSATRMTSPRHLVLMVDLALSKPADRFRAMPPLREFFLRRKASGDQVTVTLRPGSGGDIEILCSTFREPRDLADCLERLKERKSAAHEAARQRGESPEERSEQAQLALAKAIELTSGTGLRTHLLYLGAGPGLTRSAGRTFSARSEGEVLGPSSALGSVRYLVSLPRSGPLKSLARHATDRLLASALEAEATLYPLRLGRPTLSQDARLADETGGRALDLRHLSYELESLEEEIDRAIELIFERPETDSRFHRVSIRGAEGRWPNGFYASTPGEHLLKRAQAAAWLGASREVPGLRSSLEGPIAEGQTLRSVLSLSLDESGPVTLQLAVAMEDGRLLHRAKTLEARHGRIRLPLRFEAGTQALGVAARLEKRGEIATMSWPMAGSEN